MQGVKYLLNRIAQLEGDKALLLDEMEKLKKEIDVISKEVQTYGNDRKGSTVDTPKGTSGAKTN